MVDRRRSQWTDVASFAQGHVAPAQVLVHLNAHGWCDSAHLRTPYTLYNIIHRTIRGYVWRIDVSTKCYRGLIVLLFLIRQLLFKRELARCHYIIICPVHKALAYTRSVFIIIIIINDGTARALLLLLWSTRVRCIPLRDEHVICMYQRTCVLHRIPHAHTHTWVNKTL